VVEIDLPELTVERRRVDLTIPVGSSAVYRCGGTSYLLLQVDAGPEGGRRNPLTPEAR
jgi:hypothetical protein